MMTIVPSAPIHPIWGGASVCAMESEVFYAAVFKDNGVIRIDVVRKDMKDGITWDELQKVKNDCGYEDKDAVEFYPRNADVVNMGNVRHLFVFPDKLPFIRRAESCQFKTST